ncbi:MAG: sensor histidine kinase [Thermodesulfobacteriota bacterium]
MKSSIYKKVFFMSDISFKKSFIRIIFILFASVVALGTSLFLYIYWFISAREVFMEFSKKFNVTDEILFAPETWSVILILSILISLIILGLSIVYVYFQKMFNLYRLQKNFIRGFTHELKTPVTSIQLYIDTFAKHELDRSSQLKYLNYMQKDVKRLSAQIQRILNLARLESKTDQLNFETVELESFIKEIWSSYPNIFKNIGLETEEKKVFLRVDKGLFEMLILNIFNNAVKYNNSAKPILKVFITEKKNKLKIYFSDNGIGMKRRDVKKIFRQFYQVRKNKESGGTGLGLYLSGMIAKRHKGSLSARSEGQNKGTTIILTLKKGAYFYEENFDN